MGRVVLAIDNGTSECKAGFAGESPRIKTKSHVLRVKEKNGGAFYITEEAKQRKEYAASTATLKSMFDGPVVYNYEIFKGTLQALIKDLGAKDVKHIIITECFLNPKLFKSQALSVMFDTLGFETVRFGYDFVYAYEHNLKHNRNMSLSTESPRGFCDVVISMGHQGITTVPVDPVRKKILYHHASLLSFGGHLAQKVLHQSLAAKYYGTGTRIQREEVDPFLCSLFVAQEYFQDLRRILLTGEHEVKLEPREKNQVRDKPPRSKRATKRKTVQPPEEAEPESGSPVEEPAAQEDLPEYLPLKKEVFMSPQELAQKKLRRDKLIKGAVEHRTKQKLARILDRIEKHVAALEEKLLIATNPLKLVRHRRARVEELEKELKKRTFIRNELKNKKSPYSLALLKQSLLSQDAVAGQTHEDNRYLQEIKEAQLEDTGILDELEALDHFLLQNDKTYRKKEDNICDRIRDGLQLPKGGVNINIELVRTPEVIFNPSIIGIDQPGLPESLSDIFQVYDIRNILINGGFSQIRGLKERIEKEIRGLRYFPNEPSVVMALDPVYDAFLGMSEDSEYFPVYTRDAYVKNPDALLDSEI